MKISIEISYYPLRNEYRKPIKQFIEALKENEELVVKPNAISTHVFGDYDEVMQTVTRCMKKAFEVPSSVFVLKILNLDRSK